MRVRRVEIQKMRSEKEMTVAELEGKIINADCMDILKQLYTLQQTQKLVA